MRADIQRLVVLVIILVFLPTSATFANKADKAQKHQHKETHQMEHKSKNDRMHDNAMGDKANKAKSQKDNQDSKGGDRSTELTDTDKPSGQSKQQEKKALQDRKELGKGSETGQEQRKEHSRKWWKFWE